MVLMKKSLIMAILLMFISGVSIAAIPAKIEKKIEKSLKKYLGHNEFKIIAINPEETKIEELSFRYFENQLYSVGNSDENLGYIFIEKGLGRYHKFTFMVFVSPDQLIQLVRVLEYNELYGSEIMNKKWLAQFIGMNTESKIEYDETIDAISGATISSRSITKKIALVLQKLKEFKDNRII